MKKLYLFMTLLCTLHYQAAIADMIMTSTQTYYGKTALITAANITIVTECGASRQVIPWDSRTTLHFNTFCKPPDNGVSPSPIIKPFSCPTARAFTLRLKDDPASIYCSSISFDGTHFSLTLYDGRSFSVLNFSEEKNIAFIIYGNVCKDSLNAVRQIPGILQPETIAMQKPAAASPQSSCPELLLQAPLSNAVLDQYLTQSGKVGTSWRFLWQPCAGATKYQLYIIHRTAQNPLVDQVTSRTYHVYTHVSQGSFVSLDGWTWKVRGYVAGHWCPWSETRVFNIGPLPATVTGYIDGDLNGVRYSDTGGESTRVEFKKMYLVPDDGSAQMETPVSNRYYMFKNVPSGKKYKIYPDRNFITTPSFIELLIDRNGGKHPGNNFKITGVKQEG